MKVYVWINRRKRASYKETNRRLALELRRAQIKSGAQLSPLRVVDFGPAKSRVLDAMNDVAKLYK